MTLPCDTTTVDHHKHQRTLLPDLQGQDHMLCKPHKTTWPLVFYHSTMILRLCTDEGYHPLGKRAHTTTTSPHVPMHTHIHMDSPMAPAYNNLSSVSPRPTSGPKSPAARVYSSPSSDTKILFLSCSVDAAPGRASLSAERRAHARFVYVDQSGPRVADLLKPPEQSELQAARQRETCTAHRYSCRRGERAQDGRRARV